MAASDANEPNAFRPVPRTGVIYVMTEAARLGFSYGHPDWANLGQGAPETGPIPGAPDRISDVSVDPRTSEYAPVPGMLELRVAVAELYNKRYRRGMKSQYGPENVAIAGGGEPGPPTRPARGGPLPCKHRPQGEPREQQPHQRRDRADVRTYPVDRLHRGSGQVVVLEIDPLWGLHVPSLPGSSALAKAGQ